jgi:hypothetical protein
VVCTAGPDRARTQLAGWARLRESFQRAEPTPDGARLWFDASAAAPLRTVADQEAACCAFLRLAVVSDGDRVRLDIGSAHADAQPLIAVLVAEASGRPPP